MNNVLVIIFSLIDCNVWDIYKLREWADRSILMIDNPQNWIFELSLAKDLESAGSIITNAMKFHGVRLPEDIGSMLVGFILYRLDNNLISLGAAKKHILDVVDAYQVRNINVESVHMLDLKPESLIEFRNISVNALNHLVDAKFFEDNMIFLKADLR